MSDLRLHRPYLTGPRLHLRELCGNDVNENYCRWMNDPEVNRYLESRFQPHTVESLRQYVEERRNDLTCVFLAIILTESGRHIGNIKLGAIDRLHRRGDIGIIIGEKDCWGKGYATEAIGLLADHAFRELNLHKLTAGCYSDNEGSARAFEKVGFSREGLCRQHYSCDGRYVDLIMLGRVRAA